MQIIWYNADSKEYKFGAKAAYKAETLNSENPTAHTILMKLDSKSTSLANKIIKQLNIASELPYMYAAR